MEQLLSDIKFGFRQLMRHPLFTLVAVAALGLGIGAVTTQMSVTNGILIKGLPFPESDRIAHLERVNVERESFSPEPSLLEFLEWRKNQTVFEAIGGFYNGTANLTIGEHVERYSGAFISANAFEILRTPAALGRALRADDDLAESPEVLVLSHKVWNNDFGADPEIIGKSAIINGRPTTIVGVMPENFGFPVNEDMWIPLFKQQDPSSLSWTDPMMSLDVFGRLLPGVSFDKARASMGVLAAQLETQYPDTNKGYRAIDVKPFIEEFMGDQTVAMTSVMLLITLLILVIACANVANLLLARSMHRQREIAIRSALGATRSRIVHQFLTESVLIAFMGAVLGVGHALWNIQRIQMASVELGTPFWMDFSFDGRVFIGALFVTLATGILSGLVPALRASRLNESEILKDGSHTGTSLFMGKFSRSLVVLQISVAAIILTLVVLFVQSMNNALSIGYEYNPDDVLSARIGLFEENYPDDRSRAAFSDALLSQLRSRPGMEAAAMTSRYQFLGGSMARYELATPAGQAGDDRPLARIQRVSAGFFEAVQLPIHSGRSFHPEDFTAPIPRYAIVNRAFAEREWRHTNVIGQRFRAEISQEEGETDGSWLEVVGVTAGMQEDGLFNDDDGAAFFIPQTETDFPRFITLLLRGAGDPHDLTAVLRGEIASLDRNLPIYEVGTPREVNDRSTAQFRFFASIFTGFGILGTLLAAVGIYGVITFSVTQRVMEFGIRQALGATRAAVFKLVYAHALKQLGYGFVIAFIVLSPVILSPGIKESMSMFFYEIDPDSLLPYLLSFGFVAAVALLSAAPPAFRAARTEPAQALRYE